MQRPAFAFRVSVPRLRRTSRRATPAASRAKAGLPSRSCASPETARLRASALRRGSLRRCAAKTGGAERDRTADLLIANEALSQLSYSPNAGLAVDLDARVSYLGIGFAACQWPASPANALKLQREQSDARGVYRMIGALRDVLLIVLNLYTYVIIAAVIASWLVAFGVINTHNQFARIVLQALHALTEPVFAPIRRIIPPIGGVCRSSLIPLLLVNFLQKSIGHGTLFLVLRSMKRPVGRCFSSG